jgi:hypothetical protein
MSGGISAATIIAGASLAVGAAGTAMSAMGQAQQQQAQQQAMAMQGAQAVYAGQVARQNQTFAQQQGERQAADAKARGEVAEASRRRLMGQQIGEQQARLAGQGTDLEGSPTDILGDTAAAGEFDALTIRSNAAREAYGYKLSGEMAGAGYGNDATMAGYKAGNSSYTPSYLGAGASLLAGASNLGEKWLRFQQNDPGSVTVRTPGTDTAFAPSNAFGWS